MKSLYEWVELMTKERVEEERLEVFVRRCNTPHDLARLSRPVSVLTEGWSDLSQSSCSPPGRVMRGGGVFSTLYRPEGRVRHSSYITTPAITRQSASSAQPQHTARPQSTVLENFDRALAEYNQLEVKEKRKTNIETERYFDNLAALLRSVRALE